MDMEIEDRLAGILRTASHDLSRLSNAQRIDVFTLARSGQIELWRPGLRWPSSESADQSGGGVTRISGYRP